MLYYVVLYDATYFFVKNLKNNAKKTRIVLDEESSTILVLTEKMCIMHKNMRK